MHGLKKLQHFLPWQQALKDSIYNKKTENYIPYRS